MAGHSKWKNIQHRKGKQDAKKAKIFTKIIRELTIAARNGADVIDNPRLRAAVDKALSANMTRDTIDKAITRGAGKNDDSSNLEEIMYEGYGVGGTAFYIEAMTDNRNRTAGEVRHAFTKSGGNLGTSGSVGYLFKRKGLIYFNTSGINSDELLEKAIDLGAEDVVEHDDHIAVETVAEYQVLTHINDTLNTSGFKSEHSEISMIPENFITISDPDTIDKISRLLDTLEELDDVQNVYTNAELPDSENS